MANIARELVRDSIGEKKTYILERMLKIHAGKPNLGAPATLGALVRELAKAGGVFGWEDSRQLAVALNQYAFPVTLGTFEPKEPVETPEMHEALHYIALLYEAVKEDEGQDDGAKS